MDFNLYKANVLKHVNLMLGESNSLSITSNGLTVHFSREVSDQEFFDNNPELKKSILEASKSPRSEWTKVDASSFKAYKASLNV